VNGRLLGDFKKGQDACRRRLDDRGELRNDRLL
jgi:hypothetical protein